MRTIKLTRRSFIAMAGMSASAAMLAACAPKPTPVPTPAPKAEAPKAEAPKATEAPKAAPKPAGKLMVQITQKQDVSEWLQQNLDDFKAKQPDIQVEIEAIPGWTSGYFPKILAKAAANLLGDVCWYPGRHGSHLRWAAIKMIQNLNTFADAEGYKWEQFFKGALEANRWEGKQWWMSYISEPVQPVLAINKSLAAERGAPEIDPEWDWKAFIEGWATKIVLEEGGRTKYFGYRRGNSEPFGGGPTLRAFGAELMDAEGKKCLFDANDGLKQFLQFRYDVIHTYKCSPAPATGQYNDFEEFLAGRLGALDIWPWFIQIWPEQIGDKFQVDFVETPKGPTGKRRTMLNEHTLGIFQAAPNPQGAWEFVKWACSEELCVKRVMDGMGGPNAQVGVWNNKEIIAKFPAYGIVARIMENVEPDWRCANFRGEDVGPAFAQPYGAVEAAEMPVDEAVKTITDGVNAALQLPVA